MNQPTHPIASVYRRCRQPLLLTGICLLLAVVNLSASIAQAAAASLHWVCSTEQQPFEDKQDIPASVSTALATTLTTEPGNQTTTQPTTRISLQSFNLDPAVHYQTIDGWGGCFNERGWKAMEVLTDAQRTSVMRSMFDPISGLRLNICRTPIAASDYAIELYSYDETPGDFALEHFSIDRDRQRLIPYIKAAQAINPDLKLWAVPWSPPSWMKDSGVLTGGHIKTDARTMDALARYFQKYIQAYEQAGIHLYMVMPQNEPCYSNKYTSCEWNGKDLALFIRDYLGPTLKQHVPDCQIYLGTLPRSDPKKYDYAYWAAPSMNDPVARAFITGVGCQWSGDGVMHEVHKRQPEMKLMQTEAQCGDKNFNDWKFATERFKSIIDYLNAGSESHMIWNLVLDETGLSTAGWAQCSPIVIDQKTHRVIYTPYYYMFKHFSWYVRPGAKLLKLTPGTPSPKPIKTCAAFINPDGTIIVTMNNPESAPQTVELNIAGEHYAITLPASSFSTFSLPR